MKEQEKALQENKYELNDEEISMISGGGDGTGKDSQEPQKKRIVKSLPVVEATVTKVTPQDIRGDENP